MNKVFTAKFLQHLNKKKADNKEKGFTLIELLVVVIIIGVLAAVALPNLLGQVAKGRQAEAKTTLGAVNRAQQAARLETGSFQALAGLPVGVNATGNNYSYVDQTTATSSFAAIKANALAVYQDDIRDYNATVGQTTGGAFASLICESNTVNGATAAIDAVNTAGVPTCGGGSTSITQ
jgi:type IV pilus assembly protein PilA